MELRHLRYLLTVVEEGNFTRAAQRLRIAQPGISSQIKQLETELGQRLLDRTERTVRLTAAGELFLPYAQAAVDATTAGAASVAALTGLVHGRLRIGTVGTISSTGLDLPELLAGFHAAHPGVDIALQEDTSVELLDAIDHGRIDTAFVGLGVISPSEQDRIASIEILRERLVAVRTTPWGRRVSSGRRHRLPVARLVDESLIVPREGTGLRDRLDVAFAQAGIRPRIAFESGNPDLLVRLARVGLGTALVPASVVREGRAVGLAVASLTPPVDGMISLVRHRTRPLSPAAAEFVDHVRRNTSPLNAQTN